MMASIRQVGGHSHSILDVTSNAFMRMVILIQFLTLKMIIAIAAMLLNDTTIPRSGWAIGF